MARFPNWLPAPVADHAGKLPNNGDLDNASKERLKRLYSHHEMESVWKALHSAAPKESVIVEFLDSVRLKPVSLRQPGASSLSRPKLRKSFERLAKFTVSLIQ